MDIQWPLVFFTVLNGAGAWLIAFAAINEFTGKSKSDKVRRWALLIGIILVVAGGIASAMHLTHPENMMGALSHPTSGIFTEALLTGLITLASIIYMVLAKRNASKSAIKAIAAIAGILGLVLPFATGMSYMMSSRAAWNTILFPLASFVTTGVCGAALYLLIQVMLHDEKAARDASVTATGVLGLATAIVSAIYGISVGAASGQYAAMLWAGVVATGGLIPAVCALVIKRGKSEAAFAVIALASAFAGSFVFRCFAWLIGTALYNFFGMSYFGSI